MPPVPDCFVTNIDTAFVEQIFHVAQRKRKPDVQHHRKADDLWARLEVFEWGFFAQGRTLFSCPTRLKPVYSDNALQIEPQIGEISKFPCMFP